mmetsp:Transcript_65486/g.165000  ORF Transcript_65486/g.165000 Transcript_65486/m.165000 type:complete len:83 (-) Transcript_65486:110-358(-)
MLPGHGDPDSKGVVGCWRRHLQAAQQDPEDLAAASGQNPVSHALQSGRRHLEVLGLSRMAWAPCADFRCPWPVAVARAVVFF